MHSGLPRSGLVQSRWNGFATLGTRTFLRNDKDRGENLIDKPADLINGLDLIERAPTFVEAFFVIRALFIERCGNPIFAVSAEGSNLYR